MLREKKHAEDNRRRDMISTYFYISWLENILRKYAISATFARIFRDAAYT